jgi:ankyrin repeat protein
VNAGADVTTITYRNALFSKTNSVLLWAMEMRESYNIIDYLLGNSSDPNCSDKHGITLLMSSVGASGTNISMSNYNDALFTEKLIDHGADVNVKDRKGYRAFDYSLITGDMSQRDMCQRLLLEGGTELTENTCRILKETIEDKYSYNPKIDIIAEIFSRANEQKVQTGFDPVVEKFVLGDVTEANALLTDTKYPMRVLESLYYFIPARGTEESMELFRKKEESFFTDYDYAFAMFLTAAEYGNIEVMKYLLDKGYATVNAANDDPDIEYPFSPLDYAVKGGHYYLAEYLIERGAILTVANENDSDSDTLLYAAKAPNADEMTKLIFDKFRGEIKKESYSMAVRGAIESGDSKVLPYVLDQAKQAGYSLETSGLIAACESSDISDAQKLESVKILVETGANANGSDNEKSWNYGLPLSAASMYGNIETVKYLMAKNANINACYTYDENFRRSPLENAIDYGYFDIVKILVENGAMIPKDFDWESYRETGSRRIYEYLKALL